MDRISIIISVYNTSKKIFNRCIDSIEKQKNYEVYTKNQGSALARNYDIEHSNCNYLMFVDSDDVIMPNLLEDAEEIISKFNLDIVVGLVKRLEPREKIEQKEQMLGGSLCIIR